MPLGTLSYDDPTQTDPLTPKTPAAQNNGLTPSLLSQGGSFDTGVVPHTTPGTNATPSSAPPNMAFSFAPDAGGDTQTNPGTKGPEASDPWSTPQAPLTGTDVQKPLTGTSATPAAPSGAGGDTTHADLLKQIQSTTDPQQKAVLQDQLARNVYSTLQQAGHDVKWDGDNLVVDGRPYVIGGANTTMGKAAPLPQMGAAGLDPSKMMGAGIVAGDQPPVGPIPVGDLTPGIGQPSYVGGSSSSTANAGRTIYHPDLGGIFGFDTGKLKDPNKNDAKYTPAAKAFSGALGAGVQISRGGLDPIVQYLQQHGFANARVAGEDKIDFGDGHGPIDVLADQGGRDLITFQNQPPGGGAPTGGDGGPATSPLDIPHPGAPDPGTIPTGHVPGPSDPGWSPTAPTYKPGDIGTGDIPDMNVDDIMKRLQPTAPGTLDANYDTGTVSNDPLGKYSFEGFTGLGDLGPGRTNAQTEDLVSQILAHPESYPPELVDQLKAKSKDELAQMAQSDQENLTAAANLTGNADSNWLQSEQLAAKGRRDQALVASNRNIDLTAAAQNQKDKVAAAGLGQGFAESQDMMKRADDAQKLSEQQAAEGNKQAAADSAAKAAEFRRQGQQINEQLRQTAFDERTKVAQQNIENAFTSDREKQQAFALASDASLKAASLRGDRMALEEQIKQKATELGQSADTIRQNWVLGLMHDATTRYGIDVGASIDRAKLAQAGTQFQQDLAFRIMQLEQQDRQFGANFGLDFAKTEHGIDQDMYNRYAGTFGG